MTSRRLLVRVRRARGGQSRGTGRLCAAGLLAQAGLLGKLARTSGLGVAGGLVGGISGLAVNVAVARGLRDGSPGAADVVTLARATVACAVAGLVTDAAWGRAESPALVPLAAAALVLDAVDGAVARRTRSASEFGARFDGEVDALLILALSAHAARPYGWWVLTGGLARYLFAAAGWAWPWMGRGLPPRYWRKVATAAEGIVLVVAAARVLPRPATRVGLAGGLSLIGESFGRDVLWLWHRRDLPV
ncbi:MAG: CDP-alcohol phosphatidyltransferase family protein [Intrasporangium sp.]|uniref:CDP-alcohol phosphatidyltransferase family protein n=1 Tax=Intrasporangium sp. TaxID=1925024 RepID=UPI00264861D5|nr:CDP-alcohol phosphatidyltransferase family protein [Intrasporangium sp.]MDN5798060.1 CDP-alcohol phosphatidyltransferase family protein [Intrasporangium sp.]